MIAELETRNPKLKTAALRAEATVGVKKEMRGAVNEGASGGQNSGDAGGSHQPRFDTTAGLPVDYDNSKLKTQNSEPDSSSPKKTYSATEKTACSIEAMKRGEECEACQ